MAEKDLESDKLELSLFRRKRRNDQEPTAEVETSPAPLRTEPAERSEPPPSPSGGATAVDLDVQAAPGRTTTRAATSPRGGRRVRGGARVAPKTSRRPVRVPAMAPPAAALLVGAVVGLAAVALTYASLKACDLVTGTDSCGGPGLLVLLAVVVAMILGGSAALSMLGVPESGGLSSLGVAMFVALCLVVLLPSLLEPWMIVVAPVLCALTFWLAHWIVTRFDEDIFEDEGPAPHDVR